MEEMDNKSISLLKQKPERFSMSVLLFCCIKENNKYYLPALITNSTWKTYFPFHDNINKKFILKNSNSKTFSEVIDEIDNTFEEDIKESYDKAISYSENLFGCKFKIKKSKKEFLYEIKTSMSTQKLTAYKFYNYIITSVDNKKKFIEGVKSKCKLFDLDKIDQEKDLVSNAIVFVKDQKSELKRNAIKL